MRLRPVHFFCVLGLFFFALAAFAQDPSATPPTQTAAQTQVPSSGALVIKEGTEVQLKFAQDLSSKTAQEGDPVNMVLGEDLKVGDVIVAKAGAVALATVTHAKKAGMMGRAGELNIDLNYVIVGNAHMALRGTKGREGQGKEGTTVALTVLFGPIGLIKHGKNVEVKSGTPITAYVNQDFTVPTSQGAANEDRLKFSDKSWQEKGSLLSL